MIPCSSLSSAARLLHYPSGGLQIIKNSFYTNGCTMSVCIRSPPEHPFLQVQQYYRAGRRRGHIELNISLTTNFYSNNKRIGGPKSATVGRSSYFTPCRSRRSPPPLTKSFQTQWLFEMIRRPRRVDDEEVSNHRRSRSLLAPAALLFGLPRNAHTQPKSANTSPDSHLECEVPTQQTAPTETSAALSKAGDAADVLGLAWGLLRVVQFKCKQPEACFSVRVTILGSGPSQLGKKVPS